jgi:hypothetical protein
MQIVSDRQKFTGNGVSEAFTLTYSTPLPADAYNLFMTAAGPAPGGGSELSVCSYTAVSVVFKMIPAPTGDFWVSWLACDFGAPTDPKLF